ncbi:MAG TPA: malto-oligosyltrehalose trehalohydrolase [Gemmatimonadaceae bacterium]|nr:malto-oligosyltrehalose trehalohydrolase [Gemmatimonadaceae bacterium]
MWAPACDQVELVSEDDVAHRLTAEDGGYFSSEVDGIGAGMAYRFRLGGRDFFPDPASRYQPQGPHGPSIVVDPTGYEWSDDSWQGVSTSGHVIYELHVGTFTEAGTFRGAIERLPDLVDVGVTLIELMPVADFPGKFGWGYDGVNMFAPCRLYGTPDDMRAFVDAAHGLELGVILDVVYNHFGPDGNYLAQFAPRYFSGDPTEWGDAINFDGADAAPVREYFITNARYWVEEFHLDGLRLDATQQIFDRSERHILTDVTTAVRLAARGKGTFVVAENEPQDTRLLAPCENGGCEVDALWNDDFQHAANVAATGRDEAYYSGYRGVAQEFVSAAKYGFLYQGQFFAWQGRRRGTPALAYEPTRFVNFLQNHDQVANSGAGRRLHRETSPGRHRALTALLLLLPQTPMLFQGQEFGASSPFLYFADHRPELSALVRSGRRAFMSQFPSTVAADSANHPHDPSDSWAFVCSKLDWSERRAHTEHVALHRDLLKLRRCDPVIAAPRPRGIDGAVLGEHSFVLRFFGGAGDDRLLIVNLGARLHADPLAEPLMAPPAGADMLVRPWRTVFSSESRVYGGWGTPRLETIPGGWWIPAESAVLLVPGDDTTSDR